MYAIAKRIQWQWPDEYGIHRFLIMLGRLHIEMAYLSALGDWLDCSGWMADSFHDKFRQHVVSLVSMTETLENLENDETLICLNAKDSWEYCLWYSI